MQETVANPVEHASTPEKFPIGSWPNFITSDDLIEAADLEREVKRLAAHRSRFNAGSIKQRFNLAQTAYIESPSDENLESLRLLCIELDVAEGKANWFGRAGSAANMVLKNVIAARFVPWARNIIQRGLTAARSTLAEIVSREEARHFEITGEALGGQLNPVVEKARRPVRELEGMLSSIENGVSSEHAVLSFVTFLRKRSAKRAA
jgi:hypothetical protein